MGRGDNRRSPKVRQRKAWRKAKSRLAAKIQGTAAGAKAGAPKKASPSTIVKKKAKAE
jgi:hypothetical protein